METPAEFFRRLQASIPQLEEQIANDIIEVEAERFHEKNFRDEGFTDAGFKPWQPLKPTKKNQGKAILVDTSLMKGHALKGTTRGKQVDFTFPLAYMRVHNEGGKAGRGAGFTMPKRQYVGPSQYLEARIQQKVLQLLKQKFNG
jgi:phage gpG-like protein